MHTSKNKHHNNQQVMDRSSFSVFLVLRTYLE